MVQYNIFTFFPNLTVSNKLGCFVSYLHLSILHLYHGLKLSLQLLLLPLLLCLQLAPLLGQLLLHLLVQLVQLVLSTVARNQWLKKGTLYSRPMELFGILREGWIIGLVGYCLGRECLIIVRNWRVHGISMMQYPLSLLKSFLLHPISILKIYAFLNHEILKVVIKSTV